VSSSLKAASQEDRGHSGEKGEGRTWFGNDLHIKGNRPASDTGREIECPRYVDRLREVDQEQAIRGTSEFTHRKPED